MDVLVRIWNASFRGQVLLDIFVHIVAACACQLRVPVTTAS